MYSTVPAAFLAACLSTVAVTHAGAADISAAQADALQSQMQSWLQGMLGPDSRVDSRAVQVRPEGDHYRIELPLGTHRAGRPDSATLSASARPAEGGRWMFEGPELPSPAMFRLDTPSAPQRGQIALGPAVPVDYTITIGSQTSQGSYDPGFAIPSTLTTSARDMQVRAHSALTDQLTKIERSASTSTLRPSGPDRVDFMSDATIEGYTSTSSSQGHQPTELAAQRVRATGKITALSRDRVSTMVPAVVGLASGFLAAGPPGPDSKAPAARPAVDPQLLRTLLQSLQDLASEFTLDETFDGVALRSGTRNGATSQFRIGVGVKSDGGLLQASMDLSLDGLVVPDVAPGAMADLLPRRIALRPVLTGVPTEELIRWLNALSDAKDGTHPPGLEMLFRHAGVSAGLESFAVDVGGASFAGTGKLTTVSGGDLAGQAQITASNFDDLIARVNAAPELAGLLPAFIFAKGISQTVEGRLVWNFAYRNDKLLVNETDLSAMTGRPSTRNTPRH